jgi:hypothetical protein
MEKMTQDGFAWQILDYIEAENYFKDGKSIFALYDDESEALIEYDTDLNNAIDHGVQIGYAIGFIKTPKQVI